MASAPAPPPWPAAVPRAFSGVRWDAPFRARAERRAPTALTACVSALYESEKVGIDHVGVRRAHAVREPFVDLQLALFEELDGQQRGIGDRDDLIVIAMHDERRHVDDLQILGE